MHACCSLQVDLAHSVVLDAWSRWSSLFQSDRFSTVSTIFNGLSRESLAVIYLPSRRRGFPRVLVSARVSGSRCAFSDMPTESSHTMVVDHIIIISPCRFALPSIYNEKINFAHPGRPPGKETHCYLHCHRTGSEYRHESGQSLRGNHNAGVFYLSGGM